MKLRRKAIRVARSYPDLRSPILLAIREADRVSGSRTAKPWSKLPKGWTDKSVKKFWDTMTGDVKHKVTKCMKKMDGKVDDTGAFCASLADKVTGTTMWRGKHKKASDKTAADAKIVRMIFNDIRHGINGLKWTSFFAKLAKDIDNWPSLWVSAKEAPKIVAADAKTLPYKVNGGEIPVAKVVDIEIHATMKIPFSRAFLSRYKSFIGSTRILQEDTKKYLAHDERALKALGKFLVPGFKKYVKKMKPDKLFKNSQVRKELQNLPPTNGWNVSYKPIKKEVLKPNIERKGSNIEIWGILRLYLKANVTPTRKARTLQRIRNDFKRGKRAGLGTRYMDVPVLGVGDDMSRYIRMAKRLLGTGFDISSRKTVGGIAVLSIKAPRNMADEDWLDVVSSNMNDLFRAVTKLGGEPDMGLFLKINRDLTKEVKKHHSKRAGVRTNLHLRRSRGFSKMREGTGTKLHKWFEPPRGFKPTEEWYEKAEDRIMNDNSLEVYGLKNKILMAAWDNGWAYGYMGKPFYKKQLRWLLLLADRYGLKRKAMKEYQDGLKEGSNSESRYTS